MISKSGIVARVGLATAFLTTILLFAFMADSGDREPTLSATVVANIEQVSEIRTPENQVQVQLQNGSVVIAFVPANAGFPFAKGAAVQVTPYRSRFSGKRTYWVEALRAKL
jgi:hypothetical protein